jgi:hypothetical protein
LPSALLNATAIPDDKGAIVGIASGSIVPKGIALKPLSETVSTSAMKTEEGEVDASCDKARVKIIVLDGSTRKPYTAEYDPSAVAQPVGMRLGDGTAIDSSSMITASVVFATKPVFSKNPPFAVRSGTADVPGE